MRLNHIALVASLIAVLISPGARAQEREISIGAMYNLTGGQRDLDIPSSEGARLAVAQVNAAGGLLGRQVTLRLVDGETRPDVIATRTASLLREFPDIAGLIGFSDTDMVLAAAPVAAKHRRLFLTSGATSPRLPEQVPDFLFLACFADNVQAAAGAEWAYDTLKARTVAVLYNESSSYARLLNGYFQTRFKELGGDVLAVVPYQPGSIKERVDNLHKADLIYLAALPDDVAVAIPALRAAAVNTPILGGDGLDIGNAWRQVKDAHNVHFTTHAYIGPDNPDPRVQAFRAAFAQAYPGKEADAFAALGYDATRLLMAAIGNAGSVQHDAIRRALAGTRGFAGVTGTISYVDASRIPSKPVAIISIDHGVAKYAGSRIPTRSPAP